MKNIKFSGTGTLDGSKINLSLDYVETNGIEKEWFPTSPRMPDISCLPTQHQVYAGQLWGNYHSEETLWKKKEAIRQHALGVFKMSLEDVNKMMDVFERGCESPP